MGPITGSLKEIERLPDESDQDYLARALKQVKMDRKSAIVICFDHYFDVSPEMSFDYLRGYVFGYKAGLSDL